jgi:predicted HTH transcriptional regulator
MISKNLADISAADIQELIDNAVCETTTLEFKQELPGGGDDAKREFLADVSALANTSGGDLLYGVEEDNGCASAISGISRRITWMLRS